MMDFHEQRQVCGSHINVGRGHDAPATSSLYLLADRGTFTFPLIYCMSATITQDMNSGKCLHTCACEVISRMGLRLTPESADEEHTGDNNNEASVGGWRRSSLTSGGSSSQLVTQLRFMHGFTQAIYINHFTMSCQEDLQFGLPSYISRYCVPKDVIY